VRDAELHAKEDQARRDAVHARNEADALVHSVEKTIREQGGSLQPEQLGTVEAALGDVKSAMASNDTATLRPAVERLQRVSQGVAEELYRKAKAPSGEPGGAPNATSGEGEVVEGEVVDR